jgi:hypothetical protein
LVPSICSPPSSSVSGGMVAEVERNLFYNFP